MCLCTVPYCTTRSVQYCDKLMMNHGDFPAFGFLGQYLFSCFTSLAVRLDPMKYHLLKQTNESRYLPTDKARHDLSLQARALTTVCIGRLIHINA